jgi:hypothetical protein
MLPEAHLDEPKQEQTDPGRARRGHRLELPWTSDCDLQLRLGCLIPPDLLGNLPGEA